MQHALPRPNADTAAFWQAAARGELILQHCASCGHWQFPPSRRCACGAAPRWQQVSGRGIVASHTLVHRAPTAAFRAALPYLVALVRLTEGPRLMLHLRGAAAEAPQIGQAVRIHFDPPAGPDGIALPYAVAEEIPRADAAAPLKQRQC